MPDSGPGLPEPANLSDTFWIQLQAVIERLAAATTQQQVDTAVLEQARQALGALSGVILLIDGDHLRVATRQGEDPAVDTIWTDRPLGDHSPATTAVRTRQPQFYEHGGTLAAAYPDAETQTGGTAAIASAVIPILLGDTVLGVLVLDFREPHTFPEGERHFLMTLASQCAVALDRVRLLDRLQRSETQFRRLMAISPIGMGIGSLDGQLSLVNDAWLRLLGQSRLEFELGQVDWQALTPPEYAGVEQQAFTTAFERGVSVTYDKEMLTAGGERVPFQATLAPFDEQQVMGYLVDLRPFKAQEKLLRDEGERLEQLVAERTAALQAFVTFSEAAGQTNNVDELGRLALITLQAILPDSSGVLYERVAGQWRPRSWTQDLKPELLALLQQGLPLETPVFAQTRLRQAPVFVDGWSEAEQGVAHTNHYQTVATFPVVQDGDVCAVLSVALQTTPRWTEPQRAVVRAVGRSFSLLYDRVRAAEVLRDQRDELDSQTQQLAQGNAALQASNEELEAFNYSVSHDLMTPVRHVAGFASLAGQHLNDPEKAQRYLGIVDQGARRMATLIDAMLTLSRTGRRELQLGLVDLGALVEQLHTALLPEVVAREVKWRIAPLPLVYGDRVTLQQVMTNLLENALKYSAGRNPAVIEVWAEENELAWTVSVRDNGAGFDPRYADKLFGIFQRLHRQDEFEGTGVGLSLVRRIITRHGGTVSATGAVGQGATFSFTLPKPGT